MIVRDLLIKLGFSANTSGADKVDNKIKDIKGHASSAATAMGTFASQLAMMGLQKAASEMQAASDASIDFGRGMANISALMGGNEKRTLELAQAAKDLGKEFGVLPKDVSNAMYEVMGSLGDTKDTIGQVRQSILLGKSGAATAAEGFALLGSVTRTYGDTSEEAMKHVGDLSAAAVRMGKVSLPELAAALPQVTPLAKQLGVSLEDLFTPFATFTGTLGSGAEVATKFDSALTAMIKKTPQMEKTWKAVFGKDKDHSAKAVLGKYGVQGTITKLVDSAHGDMDKLADMFGRKEGLQYALALTGEQSKEYAAKVSGDMRNVTGEMQTAVNAQTSGMGAVAFSMDKAKAAAAAQRIEFGDKLAPMFVEIEVVGGRVAKMLGDLAPAFGITAEGMGNTSKSSEDLLFFLNAVKKTLILIVDLADGAMTAIRGIGWTLAAAAATAVSDDEEAAVIEAQYKRDMGDLAHGFTSRHSERQLMFDDQETMDQKKQKYFKAREAAETARGRMSDVAGVATGFLSSGPLGGKLASLVNNMGGITIHVSVPAGTEASAAAKVGDTLLRSAMGVMTDGLVRANPVQAPAAPTGSAAPSWGRLPGGA